MPSKAEFVSMCKAATKSRKEDIDDMAACIKEDSCKAVEECMDKRGDERYAKKRNEEMAEWISEGNWSKAFDECRYGAENMKKDETFKASCEKVFSEGIPKLQGADAENVKSACSYSDDLKAISPAFTKVCAEVDAKELATRKAAAIAGRDAASEDYALCFDLQTVAERSGEAAKKEAEQICAEISAARTAKQALTEAAANVAASKAEMPYYCKAAAEELAKIQPRSEWTTKKLDEVAKTCFLDLGKIIVAAELPNLSSWCPYGIEELRGAIATYQLAGKDAALDAELAKTDKVCAKAAGSP
jgi:hypothetical protein